MRLLIIARCVGVQSEQPRTGKGAKCQGLAMQANVSGNLRPTCRGTPQREPFRWNYIVANTPINKDPIQKSAPFIHNYVSTDHGMMGFISSCCPVTLPAHSTARLFRFLSYRWAQSFTLCIKAIPASPSAISSELYK